MIRQQTFALAVDAYRDLQSRKLFWITICLTLLIACSFAVIGVNAKGLQFLWFTLEIPGINCYSLPPKVLYTELFVQLGFKYWLAWIASILALISTADLFPNLMREGAVDMLLTRPISRVRLFFTR